MIKSAQHTQGFALLLTLMVVAIVLAVGITILNVTLKQYTLSVTGRESEIAFHTAGAMMDCILEARQDPANDSAFLSPDGPGIVCGSASDLTPQTSAFGVSGGVVYHHPYTFDYLSGQGACGELSVYILHATTGDINLNFESQFSTQEGIETATCREDNTCTYAFARGFNRSCADVAAGSLRTVQREFTIRF